ADDNIARLDVAMQDAARMGVLDRIAHVEESSQELPQFQRAAARVLPQHRVGVEALDGRPEAVTADEPHGIVRPTIGVGPQAIDRDDPGMLQAPGDLRLQEEPAAASGIVGVVVEHLLESHLAVELGVHRNEYLSEPPPRMWPQDTKAVSTT